MATSNADNLSETIEGLVTQRDAPAAQSGSQPQGIILMPTCVDTAGLGVIDVPLSGERFIRRLLLHHSESDLDAALTARLPKHEDGIARVFEIFRTPEPTVTQRHQDRAQAYLRKQYPKLFKASHWKGFWRTADSSSVWNISHQWTENKEGVAISTVTNLCTRLQSSTFFPERSSLRCYHHGDNSLLGV